MAKSCFGTVVNESGQWEDKMRIMWCLCWFIEQGIVSIGRLLEPNYAV